MILFVVSLIIILNVPSKDSFWAPDKAKHFGASYIASTFFYVCSRDRMERPRVGAFAFTLTLGVLKELYDWKVKGKFFSFKDLFYDMLGAGCILMN